MTSEYNARIPQKVKQHYFVNLIAPGLRIMSQATNQCCSSVKSLPMFRQWYHRNGGTEEYTSWTGSSHPESTDLQESTSGHRPTNLVSPEWATTVVWCASVIRRHGQVWRSGESLKPRGRLPCARGTVDAEYPDQLTLLHLPLIMRRNASVERLGLELWPTMAHYSLKRPSVDLISCYCTSRG